MRSHRAGVGCAEIWRRWSTYERTVLGRSRAPTHLVALLRHPVSRPGGRGLGRPNHTGLGQPIRARPRLHRRRLRLLLWGHSSGGGPLITLRGCVEWRPPAPQPWSCGDLALHTTRSRRAPSATYRCRDRASALASVSRGLSYSHYLMPRFRVSHPTHSDRWRSSR